MSDTQLKRPVLISEEEAVIIEKALLQYAKRCRHNSKSCLSGYGSCDSREKSKQWLIEADQAEEISTSVMYQTAGL